MRSKSGRPETLAAVVRAEIHRLDAAVPVHDVYTLDRHVRAAGGGFGADMFAAMVTGVLGALALTLALVGTYGVLSFTVRARTREIGIRVALGLEPGRVFRMLLWETWSIALSGVAIGVALSLAIGQAMKGFLFGVVPYDPVTLLAVIAVMAAVSTLVGVVPARGAARVNPIETLRYE